MSSDEYMSEEEKKKKVKESLDFLIDKGFSYQQIQELLEDRVNSRTLYRWAKGNSVPQRKSDIRALDKLVENIK